MPPSHATLSRKAGVARNQKLDKLLVQLALPSLGQWVGFLRETARHWDDSSQTETHPVGQLWKQLNKKHSNLPSVLALYQRIKSGPDGTPSGEKSCTVLQLFDLIVQYRNTVFGHGANRVASFYSREMGPLLFPAVTEILSEGVINLLGSETGRLIHVSEIKKITRNEVEILAEDLTGMNANRLEPISIATEMARELEPNCVCVQWTPNAAPVRLDPLLAYSDSELTQELLFLNRDRNNKTVEYLSYTTGKTDRMPEMVDSMKELMELITDSTVGSTIMDELATESLVLAKADLPPQFHGVSDETASKTPEEFGGHGESDSNPNVIDDFEVMGELGRGAMGIVYLAKQLSLGRIVAIKVLPIELVKDETAMARFRQEARVQSRCEHPNIVKVLFSGSLRTGQPYYAMEFVSGADLDRIFKELTNLQDADLSTLDRSQFDSATLTASKLNRIQTTYRVQNNMRTFNGGLDGSAVTDSADDSDEGRTSFLQSAGVLALPPLADLETQSGSYGRRVVEIIRDAALAVQAVHDTGAIHRDIKPSNLVLTADASRIVLMDFGLAKDAQNALTDVGSFLGTLRYAAPEQLASATLEVGPLVDIRALGVTLWELLTRQRLFADAADELQLAQAVLEKDVPRLSQLLPDVSLDLDAIVDRATRRSMPERIQTAAELATNLDLFLKGEPILIEHPQVLAEPSIPSGQTQQDVLATASQTTTAVQTDDTTSTARGSRSRQSKLWITGGLLVALVIGCWCTYSALFGRTTVRVAMFPFVGYAPFNVAKQQALMDGIDLELVMIDDPVARRQALLNGDVDITMDVLDSVTRVLASGTELKVILQIDVSNGADGIVAKNDIRDLKHLAQLGNDGKRTRIGVVSGETSHFYLLGRFREAGLSLNDIEIVPLKRSDVKLAIRNDMADAVVAWEPELSQIAEGQGLKILTTSKDTSDLIIDVAITSERFLKENPLVVKKFVNGWFKTLEYIESHPIESAKLMGIAAKVSSEEFAVMTEGVRFCNRKDNEQFFGEEFGPRIKEFAKIWASGGVINSQTINIESAYGADVSLDLAAPELDSRFLVTAPQTIDTQPRLEVRGVTDKKIVLGMCADLSGSAQELGSAMKLGIELKLNEVNDSGGIHGRRLKLIALDDEYEPEKTKQQMHELIEQHKVFAVIGNVGTPTAKAAIPIVREHGLPFFAALTGSKMLRTIPPDQYIYNFRVSYEEEVAAQVEYLVNKRGIEPNAIAAFTQDDAFGASGFDGLVKALNKYGIARQSIVHAKYERNSLKLTPAVKILIDNKDQIKAIVVAATSSQTAELINSLAQQNFDPQISCISFVGSKGLASELKKRGDDLGKGCIVTQVVPHYAADLPAVRDYNKQLKIQESDKRPDCVSLEGYLAATVFVEALKNAGRDLNSKTLVAALGSIAELDIGLGVSVKFTAGEDHQAFSKVWATQLNEEGEFVPLALE